MRYSVHLLVAFCVGLLAGACPAQAGRRVALVIGNSAYQHTQALPNPRNDADALAKLLKESAFDDVLLRIDLDYRGMREAVRLFGKTGQDADIALVYYAGHGLEVAGENYLVPIDARLARDIDLEYEAITLASVLSATSGARKLKLVILDACRNNPLSERMVLRTGANRSVRRGLARIEPKGEVLVAYAAKAGTMAADGLGKHSPYAEALLKHMATPGLDVLRMLGRVKEDVLASTKDQEPWIYGSPSGESIALVPAKAAPPAAPIPKGPAADEVAWSLIKDSNDPDVFRRFAKEFPNSPKRAEAERRASSLTSALKAAPPKAAPPPSKAAPGNSKCFTFQGRHFCE